MNRPHKHKCVQVLKLFQSACTVATVHKYSPAIPERTAADHSQHDLIAKFCVFVVVFVFLTVHTNKTP